MTTAVAAPFRFFSLQVARTERLGPSLVRVSFAGDDLRFFHSDGRDQSLSLFLPHPGQEVPAVPHELGDGWWQAWRELPDDVRAVMRSYTLRSLRRDPDEVDIDFVLHTPAGPASSWASRATPGDRVLLLGPAVADNRAIRFRAPEDTDLVVIWGDETAVPAVSAILDSLPAGTRARVWLEVRHAGDVQDLATEADAEITWLVGEDGLDAVRAARLPSAERPYVWTAGESGRVKALRRHFVAERGIDRRRVTFVGYWRHGMTEEQLRAAA
ncbi:siderophore-interacting protein [Streptomyces sp. LBUM 1478]|uniref:siderophore-interacting protein n=1 Tax=Streptomyces scabiei TaxID=1930 RepID=UPI00076602C1|nr:MULTISPECIES: siderophore-interacting protein [Streptomyces]MBP5906095.1 siderophore-interacting protein [Streptomyces sp. LBUM 1478]MBP5931346.1 siderophore-interacting protein [Streptomyces sp. LBUM 1479]MBP5893503.1 siderophore-interacting protein [Streptomyces sp. LBUM 1481]MBP5923746.1 siderophore-interacting protein [Streptomyces sp. LBUM 1483]MDX2538062.1 siderophore-interacting protein [Streptomyces scabiei]